MEDKELNTEISPDEQIVSEVNELKQKLEESKDSLLRALAEIENTKRRLEKEKEDISKYVISNFAKDLLIVVDTLKLALKNCPDIEEVKAIKDGVALTLAELEKVFTKNGIVKIESEGKSFDPNYHQAVFEMENEEVEHGKILNVVQEGYIINDRLLRAAMVGVSKKKSN